VILSLEAFAARPRRCPRRDPALAPERVATDVELARWGPARLAAGGGPWWWRCTDRMSRWRKRGPQSRLKTRSRTCPRGPAVPGRAARRRVHPESERGQAT